ncbi:hypothetical protein GCM10010261_07780 [Streptomyces pilosus]|uniref:Uncharacterized protein n=1 Tax=Streptomyces pilosus TaxID=28893 RepID=A0A918BDC7_9ACTN|nr:hypothetical protein GCM10010280_03780 [Streptomyces pilosus]GGV37410.1 hypothetical protein GCM10010261_07780 [Streptomyces pilosus]
MVFAAENGKFRESAFSDQKSGPVTDRRVKYIAKRAAKNISSELSQMMVPTLVRFGRLTDGCACPVSTVVAVATPTLCRSLIPPSLPGVPFGVFPPPGLPGWPTRRPVGTRSKPCPNQC